MFLKNIVYLFFCTSWKQNSDFSSNLFYKGLSIPSYGRSGLTCSSRIPGKIVCLFLKKYCISIFCVSWTYISEFSSDFLFGKGLCIPSCGRSGRIFSLKMAGKRILICSLLRWIGAQVNVCICSFAESSLFKSALLYNVQETYDLVSFAKYRLFYRALLQKNPII